MKKRFEVRRSVKQAMEVVSSSWDEPVLFETSDLSPRGAYIDSQFMPEMGEYVVCSFSLGSKHQYDFFGQVVRTNLMRRVEDQGKAGFGVEFLDCKPLERIQIRENLRGTPPPLPVMRVVPKDAKVKRRK